MLTAFNNYKAQQQKGKTKGGTDLKSVPRDPNASQALFDMMDKTMEKIRSIDPSAWTDEEKANFQTALRNLRIEINNRLVE